MRGNAEPVQLINGQTLNVNGKTVISDALPVGEGWYRALLRFNQTQVVGTGAGPIAEGCLHFIKNIIFKTDRGEILVNVCGKALYYMGAFKSGVATYRKDAMAAASATYHVYIPIYFAEALRLMSRPEDTILDTKRYSSLQLEIYLGTTADWMTAPGTATAACTLDLEVIRTKGNLPKQGEPKGLIEYDTRYPVIPTVSQDVFLARANDLAYKRLYVNQVETVVTGVLGEPCNGVDSDLSLNLVSIKDQSGFIVKERLHDMVQVENQLYFDLQAAIGAMPLVGWEVQDFVQEGSIQAALVTAGKTLLSYHWTNLATVLATQQVTVITEGVRLLK